MLGNLLLGCRQSAVGCKLISLQLGDAVIMATQAALAALMAMQPALPKAKKALKSPKPGKQPLLAKLPADLGFLGDLVPEAVRILCPKTSLASHARLTSLRYRTIHPITQ